MRSEEVYDIEDWTDSGDESRYVPTEQESREAAQLFGELEDALDVAEFEAWLEGLHQERFREVTRALDVLRSALIEYRAAEVLERCRLLGWLDDVPGRVG